MEWLSNAPVLFKTSAVLYAISIPAHIYMGFDITYPALRKIPATGQDAIGRRGAECCWNFVAAALAIAACSNWQWAQTGGPQTLQENVIFWLIAGMNSINGARYFQVGSYGPLAPLWVSPVLSVMALRSIKS